MNDEAKMIVECITRERIVEVNEALWKEHFNGVSCGCGNVDTIYVTNFYGDNGDYLGSFTGFAFGEGDKHYYIPKTTEHHRICGLGYCPYAEPYTIEDCEIDCTICPHSITYEKEGDKQL